MMRPWKGQEQFPRGSGIGAACHIHPWKKGSSSQSGLWRVGADISSAKDSFGPSYIKAKGCAEKEKYKIDPTPVPPCSESPP